MLLTVDELRGHVSTDLEDDDLLRLLEAAEADIDGYAPPGVLTESFDCGGSRIFLARRARSVTSVTQTVWSTDTVLDATDYIVSPSGYWIQRVGNGTHGGWSFRGRLTVVYVPDDDTPKRVRCAIELVKLALNAEPGTAGMETIGAWSEQRTASSVWNPYIERDAILATLRDGPGMVVVG